MFDFIRWNQMKLDAPPGTLTYVGRSQEFEPKVELFRYNEQSLEESVITDGPVLPTGAGMVNFVMVTGVHQADLVRDIGAELGIAPLYLEDVLNTGQRPKFSWVDDDTGFVVLKHMEVDGVVVEHQQVSFFWRGETVLVFLEQESDLLAGLVSRIRKGRGRIRKMGPHYLVSAVLDAVVDNYMRALSSIGDTAQELEGLLAVDVSDDLLGRLYELKRETIIVRNALLPVRDIFKALLREDAEFDPDVVPFLEDTAGHSEQTLEAFTSLHDILKSMIDYQISLIGIRTNRVMQLLTVIATIFIPLTFIAGIYGMNFTNMPELSWKYGYHAVMVSMVIIGVAMLLFFKRKRYF